MSAQPQALILTAPGINCNAETGYAFEQAGAKVSEVHITELETRAAKLADYDILALAGGFSHGDAIRSGAILGTRLCERLSDDLNRFVELGKPILGICNGFQVLVETGMLPDGVIRPVKDREAWPKLASLTANYNFKFEDRWTHLTVASSKLQYLDESTFESPIELPVAHGEGRLVTGEGMDISSLHASEQVVLSYATPAGDPTEDYPANPNGTEYGIAGICDPSGVVLGMMPHPERFVQQWQHPRWQRGEGQKPFGAKIFSNIVKFSKES